MQCTGSVPEFVQKLEHTKFQTALACSYWSSTICACVKAPHESDDLPIHNFSVTRGPNEHGLAHYLAASIPSSVKLD